MDFVLDNVADEMATMAGSTDDMFDRVSWESTTTDAPTEVEELVLRDYQERTLTEVLNRFAGGQGPLSDDWLGGPQRKVIICAPTGSGKTVLAARMLKACRERGQKALFICDRIALVDQTSAALKKFGVPHGVLQGDRHIGKGSAIMVCSAQTLESRNHFPSVNLVIVDEAHMMRRRLNEYIQRTKAYVIGLTATPFVKGLADIYDGVVNTTTTQALIDEKWIVPLRVYVAREIDMEGARTNANGEWQAIEIQRRGQKIVGDMLTEWERKTQEHYGGPVKTLVFSATVAHGADICKQFQEAGYDFRQVSYLDRDLEARAKMIQDFRDGKVQGLVSVEALAKGFDVPDVHCIIDARPYRKSLAGVVQQLGRGMRPSPGKEYCLVLDHAGNCHGFAAEIAGFFKYGVRRLKSKKDADDGPTRLEEEDRSDIVCPNCDLLLEPGMMVCPACGVSLAKAKGSPVEVVDGRLEEFDFDDVEIDWAVLFEDQEEFVWGQMCRFAYDMCSGDFVRAQKLALAQFRQLYGRWPEAGTVFEPTEEDQSPDVKALMAHQWREYRRQRNGG